jgi:hypothetical protein
MPFSEKHVRARGAVEAGDRLVKRYHITAAGEDIADGIQRAAYAFLPLVLP